jgi:hypothetical protein
MFGINKYYTYRDIVPVLWLCISYY